MKQHLKSFGLLVSMGLLTSCGASIGAIPAGFPYGGNGGNEKLSCNDLAQNAISLSMPATTNPTHVIVSIDQGRVLYDACDNTTAAAASEIQIASFINGRLAMRLPLPAGSTLRQYYFGSATSPLRTSLQIYVASRANCGDPDQLVLSRDNATVSWQMASTSTSDCPSNPVNYQGTATF